jgi:hypothetical protein
MKFIHFGCWNNGKCDKQTGVNGLSKTMRKLDDYISHNDINFMVVAGDNYYPDKQKIGDKKVKNMISENFMSGLNCLPKNIKKYILLGNHEYDNMNVDGNKVKNCYLLKKEKEFFNNPDDSFFQNVIFVKYGLTLIIMIDTTIYEEEPDKNIDKTCYTEVFNDLDQKISKEKINDLIVYQQNKVNEIIEQNIEVKNIILIGHHPIISIKLKEKGGEVKEKEEVLDRLCELFTSFSDKVTEKNLYYLCADTHNHQEGLIKLKNTNIPPIKQYICGTGGADQDVCGRKESLENDTLIYSNILCEQSFGFLVCNIKDDDSINFNFIKVDDEGQAAKASQTGGKYYKKYMKYKNKYLLLKNNYSY